MIYVIFPAFNEEKVIRPTLLALVEGMKGKGLEYRAVLVDDGSTDRTATVMRDWSELPGFRT